MNKYTNILFLSLFISSPSLGGDQVFYDPVVDVVAKPGTNRSLGSINFMIPLMQEKNKLLFADIRTVMDNQDNKEGNFGLGYRQVSKVFNQDAIIGGYGFYDRRRSEFDHYFSQATIGGEILTQKNAARINLYKSLGDDEKVISDAPDTATLLPTGFVLLDQGLTLEKGLSGYDIEVGARLPILDDSWAHIAHYSFGVGDDIDLDGVRFRAHTQLTDMIRVGVESSYDNIRGSNHFAEIRFRFPFGNKGKRSQSAPKGIYKYMMEPIVRDIDIVTGSIKAAAAPATGPGGKPEKYIFVDNTVSGGGDGTPGNPFNNLTAAINDANATNGDNTIFVRQGDGTTTNMATGINLNEKNLRFIGSKINLTTRGGVFLEAATAAPHITHGAGDTVTIADNNIEVAGFYIDTPAFDGIFVQNYDDANIHDNDITGAGNNGINAAYTSNKFYNVTIANNTVDNSTLKGIILRSYNGADVTATLTGNTANNNTQAGIQLEGGGTNSSINATVTESITNNNGGAGLSGLFTSSLDTTININTLISNGNSVNGMSMITSGTGTHDITASNISADGNTGHGIAIDIQDSTTATVTLANTTTSNSTSDGLNIIGRTNSTSTIDVTNHTSTGSTLQGVDVTTEGVTTSMNITMDDITSTTSGDAGLLFLARGSSTLTASLNDADIQNSGGVGLFIQGENTANIQAQVDASDVLTSGTYSVFLRDITTGTYNADLGGGSLGSLGQNRVFGGTLFDVYGDLNGTNVFAQSNWWGVGSGLAPAEINLVSGGTIDSSNFLVTDPRP